MRNSKVMTLASLLNGGLVGSYLVRDASGVRLDLDKLNKAGLRRQAEVRAINEEDRTVELAFSSEIEVERYFGIEILDHAPESVRLGRLEGGAALLVNHNWDDQVGVVESVSIDADRRGRAVVRFGKGARASEVWQDVVDGIRRHVSVGYFIHGYEVTEREAMPPIIRVTDWEPYEISLVSVPADPSVGVGRSLENPPEEPERDGQDTGTVTNGPSPADNSTRGNDMNVKNVRDAQGNLVRAKVDEAGNIVEALEVLERAAPAGGQVQGGQASADAAKILELGEQYRALELAAKAVREGKTVAQFQRELLDHINTRNSRPLGEQMQDAEVGMSDREVRQFSFLRAFRALANPTDRKAQQEAAFEFEASRAAADKLGREAKGLFVPADVLTRALNTGTSGTNPGDTGGYTVATDLLAQSFIDLLRNKAVFLRRAAAMGGLVGNVDIPKQAAGATGYWIGEDDDAQETGVEFEQVSMSPKTVAGFSEITRRMLMQSSLDSEAIVRKDLATALALAIDLAGFYGSGSANQPMGVFNTTGINAVEFAGDNPTYAELVQMETEVAVDNADVDSMAYIINARTRGYAKTTEKFSGTGLTLWEPGGTLNGYGVEVTNQIANGDVGFGNFADALVAMWGGLDLTVDPYTHSTKGRIRIVAMQDVDIAVRREESFCLGRKKANGGD